MLVTDTSAFVSLAVGDMLDPFLHEFDVVATRTVVEKLERTAEYDDPYEAGATDLIERTHELRVLDVNGEAFTTSRIDAGEARCVAAVRETDAPFPVTSDYRALPELQELVGAEVALSPVVLRALVERDPLDRADATAAFEAIAEGRDWLGAPIHRYARHLLD